MPLLHRGLAAPGVRRQKTSPRRFSSALKNAERRAEHAVQDKLDTCARAMLESRRGTDDGAVDDLEHAIGRHQDV
ncbi:MAG: hypothetical protein LC790_05290 [Actinobacteria bacterium]|nr:hypothetical protein [Actinomycetota bacterium]